MADSHELAEKVPEVKGVAQQGNREIQTKDIRWHKPTADIPGPLIGDVPNGQLWSMIRRFNKVRKTKCYYSFH